VLIFLFIRSSYEKQPFDIQGPIGELYTLSGDIESSRVVLNVGEQVTVNIDGESYRVSLSAIGEGILQAAIVVNSESETVNEYDLDTISGIQVFTKTIFRTGDNTGYVILHLFPLDMKFLSEAWAPIIFNIQNKDFNVDIVDIANLTASNITTPGEASIKVNEVTRYFESGDLKQVNDSVIFAEIVEWDWNNQGYVIFSLEPAKTYRIVVDGYAPPSEWADAVDISSHMRGEDFDFNVFKNIEVSKSDLEDALTTFIYNQKALIIKDSNPTDVDDKLIDEIKIQLNQKSVSYKIISSSEVINDDLRLTLNKKFAPPCTENDDGRDYYVKGHTYGWADSPYYIMTPMDDYCDGLGNLVENYCDGIYIKYEYYSCPNGCSNGACIPDAPDPVCTDSDNGKDYFVKGYSRGESLNSNDTNAEDFCDSEGRLHEYYCHNDRLWQELYHCSNGCENGVCKRGSTPPPSGDCTDSDGGIEYEIKGTTSGIKVDSNGKLVKTEAGSYIPAELTDHCDEFYNYQVYEYYCRDDGGVGLVKRSCPSMKCVNGVCINGNQPPPYGKFLIGGTEVQIEESESRTLIKTSDFTISTNMELVKKSPKLYIKTSAGWEKELRVLPELENFENTNIQILEHHGQSVYFVTGFKTGRFLFIIPVNGRIKQKINTESGNLEEIEKPWWSFLASGI
jgi:hypothetical protein